MNRLAKEGKVCSFGIVLLLCLVLFSACGEAADDDQWYWLDADSKYSNFFRPSSVVVTKEAKTAHGMVPTEIQADIKTEYSAAGAQETIQAYGIRSIVPDPTMIVRSEAHLRIHPQTRTVQYMHETFYNNRGTAVWSRIDGTDREVNSQSFDEKFYAAVVDQVFHGEETKRRLARDRWLKLWQRSVDGLATTVSVDTTTLRHEGNDIVFWEWNTVKDATGNTLEVQFLKKGVDFSGKRIRLLKGQVWSGTTGWLDTKDEAGGGYHIIEEGTPGYWSMLVLLRYVKANENWVNRYRLD